MENYVRINKTQDWVKEMYGKSYDEIKALPETIISKEGTDEEFVLVPYESLGLFYITSLSMDDFENVNVDKSKLTPEICRCVAESIADYFNESGTFRDYLVYSIDNLKEEELL